MKKFTSSSDSEGSSSSGDAVVSSSWRYRFRQNVEVSLAVEKRTWSMVDRRCVKKASAGARVRSNEVAESQPMESSDSKRKHEVVEIERSTHCRYDSEEILIAATGVGELIARETLRTTSALTSSSSSSSTIGNNKLAIKEGASFDHSTFSYSSSPSPFSSVSSASYGEERSTSAATSPDTEGWKGSSHEGEESPGG